MWLIAWLWSWCGSEGAKEIRVIWAAAAAKGRQGWTGGTLGGAGAGRRGWAERTDGCTLRSCNGGAAIGGAWGFGFVRWTACWRSVAIFLIAYFTLSLYAREGNEGGRFWRAWRMSLVRCIKKSSAVIFGNGTVSGINLTESTVSRGGRNQTVQKNLWHRGICNRPRVKKNNLLLELAYCSQLATGS